MGNVSPLFFYQSSLHELSSKTDFEFAILAKVQFHVLSIVVSEIIRN